LCDYGKGIQHLLVSLAPSRYFYSQGTCSLLSANAYTLGQKARLAISLAWVGGFVDAIGFYLIKFFTSHMSGNSASLGRFIAERDPHFIAWFIMLIGAFFLGGIFSGLVTENAYRRHYHSTFSLALSCEAIMLAALLLYCNTANPRLRGIGFLAAFAMGIQNATITQIAGEVRTTHVTGVVTDLGLEGVQYIYWFRDKTRGRFLTRLRRTFYLSPRHPSVQRLILLLSIWSSFVIGALLGGIGYHLLHAAALAAPLAFLIFMIARDITRPIARVDPVDSVTLDAELRRYGLAPGTLPKAVGVYRVSNPTRNLRPPDLSHLHRRIGHREKILLLLLAENVVLSDNSIRGLHNSLRHLRAMKRDLVISVHDAKLFVQLRNDPFTADLDPSNLCSDPEFAAARALDLL
jgi:uncharacterized membrane protein YoaK (UPF0700 family)